MQLYLFEEHSSVFCKFRNTLLGYLPPCSHVMKIGFSLHRQAASEAVTVKLLSLIQVFPTIRSVSLDS